MCRIKVCLGYDLDRRVHTYNGNSDVYRVNVKISYKLGNGTAASDIYLSELSRLPDDIILGKYPSDPAYSLSRSVTRAALAS